MQPPSKELLEKAKSGDREAFGELYKCYRQPCYAFARMLLKTSEDAEDAVQNTFIRMYGGIGTLQSDNAFIIWMERILNRECHKIAQRRCIEIAASALVSTDRVSDVEEEYMLPEPYAERNDLSQRLKSEIEKLTFEQRRDLLLFYYHDLSLQQIAEVTDSNLNTVKSRLRYARMHLKDSIEQQEKQSGDKFYGVPLLPFRDILTRVLDREKGEKKPSALWKSLQKDIDAVCGGFNGRLPDGRGHAAKVVAGVLAAMLTLGAAAGTLTGALDQKSGKGWSSLQGEDQEQNPIPISSTEPGTRIDTPVQNPNQNLFAPFDADDPARNVFNTTQNIVNNNPQAPAVQPTQAAPNSPLLPTQPTPNSPISPTQTTGRSDDPVEPTQSPETTAEQSGNAYRAYRDLLLQNDQAIRNYNWQYSDGSYPVALADVFGDGTPELLYISASGNAAALHIYTYDGEKTVSLLNNSDGFSSVSDVNDAYFLYQKSGDKRLYLYTASDGDYGTFRNIRFQESGTGLRAVELSSGRLYPSQYTVGGRTVSESAYFEYEKSLFSDISGILLRNDTRGMCSQEAYDALTRYSSRGMSLNDMLNYLEE